MSIQALVPLLLFTLAAALSPGGATTLATITGVNYGFRRSLPLIGGLAASLAAMAALSGAGLGGLLLAAPSLQLALKGFGSLYLLWLAWQIGRRGAPDLDGATLRPPRFMTGVWVQSYNPKAWAVTAGAGASFAALADGPGRLALLLALAFGASALLSLTLWCNAGALFARRLRTDRQWRILNAVLGLLLALSIVPLWIE